jgi:uncharacterized protein (TIGR03437 family)
MISFSRSVALSVGTRLDPYEILAPRARSCSYGRTDQAEACSWSSSQRSGMRALASPFLSAAEFALWVMSIGAAMALPLFGSPSSITLVISLNPSILGKEVVLTATVSPPSATGNVTFYDGTAVLGMRKLSSGSATFSAALLPSGVNPLKAYYGGDTSNGPSTSQVLRQTVNAAPQHGFNPPAPFGTGPSPQYLALGDFNGDGNADVATANYHDSSISVLLGTGDGHFQAAVAYKVGNQPSAIAVGDFNSDGKPDLAVTNFGDNNFSILLGNGDGTFQPAVAYPVGVSPKSIAAGDFNGDGLTDLVVANEAGASISVLLGNGKGAFQAAKNYATGLAPSSVVIGDFNGDGNSDIATSNFSANTVSILLGNGDGTFQTSASVNTGVNPTFMATGDFNGDGLTDLAVAQNDSHVNVLLGNGDGTFRSPLQYSVSDPPLQLAVGDVNGDGIADIVTASFYNVSVLYGRGTGDFVPAATYLGDTIYFYAALADLNGDGLTEIIVAAGNADSVEVFQGVPSGPDVAIVLNHPFMEIFSTGQSGANYTITVSNVGNLTTSGAVTVSDTVPTGLSATGIGGNGWTCALDTLTCTRTDALAASESYPVIILTVSVSQNAPAAVTNSATVSGGADVNSANNSVRDFTPIFTPNQIAHGWQPLKNQPPIPAPFIPIHGLLLTDGTIIVQGFCSSNWYRLTPDMFGSYANGTWSSMPSMQSGYSPAFYSSAVLADGRVIVIGGEYNNSAVNCTDPANVVDTNLGAIYDPTVDTWTPLAGPPGWSKIGDAPNVVLPDGSFLLGNISSTQVAKLDPASMTWTNLKSTNKADQSFEEGWTLLPDGTVLTVDISNGTQSETYNPATDTWTPAGSTVVPLISGSEIGGGVLRPDGTVFVTGATGHTSIYDYRSRKWSPGPDFPILGGIQLNAGDWPGALLPNGNVLVSGDTDSADRAYFEFDGKQLNPVPAFYAQDLLLLPTGQVLNSTGTMSIYTPSGNPDSGWAPTISSAPTIVFLGQTYTISGTQFNGLSQGVNYGDEAQAATNYPLVRITNPATMHVFYCRTHNHSTMGVATGTTPVSTQFDVPQSIESGPSILEVVANGIASSPWAVIVQQLGSDLTITMRHSGNFTQGQAGVTYAVAVANSGSMPTSGTVTVVWSPPVGLTATAIAGTGWACSQPSGPCTRADVLAANASYPVLTLTANLDGATSGIILNSATVAGGSEVNQSNDTASDPTTIIGPGPTIDPGGVVPIYSSASTIQPGSWISIFGSNLASAFVTWNNDFPTSLGDTKVTIDNKPAYLWYVSPGQINLQAPDDTAKGSVTVAITTPSGTATSTVILAQFGPSFCLLDGKHVAGIIFRTDGSGAYGGGSYDIVGPNGTSLGYKTVAAKAGDTLALFGVGFGPTYPSVLAGQAYSGAAPTNYPVQLFINDVGITPAFSGITSAGLYQINIVQLPPGLGTGDVSLRAAVGGAATPSGVVISLQE